MCELIIDAELQSLLDASRAKAERRAAEYPHFQRAVPHAAGRPSTLPPTPREISIPTSTELGVSGNLIKEITA